MDSLLIDASELKLVCFVINGHSIQIDLPKIRGAVRALTKQLRAFSLYFFVVVDIEK